MNQNAQVKPHEKRVGGDRRTAMRLGHITLSDGEVIQCVVRDLSSTGAKLAVARRHVLPERFDLTISGLETPFPMRRAWRRGDYAGVMLICGSVDSSSAPKVAADDAVPGTA